MKYILTFVLCCCVITLFAQSNTENWKTLIRKNYLVQVPGSWEIDTVSKRSNADLIALSPISDSLDMFRENINVIVSPLNETVADESIEELFEETSEQIKEGMEEVNFEMNSGEKKNNFYLQKMMYTAKNANFKLRFIQYFFLTKKEIIVVTVTTESKSYYAFKSIADKILASIKLLQD